MSYNLPVPARRRALIGKLAIAFAAAVGVVPIAAAQDLQVAGQSPAVGSPTGGERPAHHGSAGHKRVSVAEPIGRIGTGPEFVDGEPVYVRRTTVTAGIIVVEASTTPFLPTEPSSEDRIAAAAATAASTVRPETQPASW